MVPMATEKYRSTIIGKSLRIQAQDNEYILSLTAGELHTILNSLLLLPDRYSDEAIEDLVGCSKEEISDLEIKIGDGKYAIDHEKARQELAAENGQNSIPSENLTRAGALQELTERFLEAAMARGAAIETQDTRHELLAELAITDLLDEISIRPGGKGIIAELAAHDNAAIRFAIADQWHSIDPQTAVQILEEISHDTTRPLLAYAAGFKRRQSMSPSGSRPT
jgi:hypothetical protein